MVSQLIREKFIATQHLKSKGEYRFQRIVQSVIVKRLIQLASSSQASHDAVAIATANLQKLSRILATNGRSIESAHKQLLKQKIDRFLSDSPTWVIRQLDSPNHHPEAQLGISRYAVAFQSTFYRAIAIKNREYHGGHWSKKP